MKLTAAQKQIAVLNQFKTNSQHAIHKINEYVQQHGGKYSDWHMGIAADPRGKLFTDYRVDRTTGSWIFTGCGTLDASCNVVKHFAELGCKVVDDAKAIDAVFVFAYRGVNRS
ncbi:MAG: hypothetical protein ABJZ55_05035 [Fuerstiella sp.]